MEIIGGFGFRWHEDDWLSWDILHKPMIDATIDLIDGVCDHHYQGLPEAIPASYEVLAAYTTTRFDKMLYGVNTEANDLWDAPARGNVAATDQSAGRYTSRRRLIYNTRDMLYAIGQTPDKAFARATHAQWAGARDMRVQLDQSISYEKKRKAGVDGFTIVADTTVTTPDGEVAAAAESGHQLVVVDYNLTNEDRRDRGYRPNDSRLHVVSNGERQRFEPTAVSMSRVSRKGVAEVVVPGNDTTAGHRVVFSVPRELLAGDAIIEWQPRNKHGQRFHLDGPFPEFQVSPWRRIGINEGEYHAYYALRNLRGQLVASESSSKTQTISSIDEQTNQLVTVVWNDDWETKTVNLTVTAPAGTSFSAGTNDLLFHEDGTVESPVRPSMPTAAS